jgi:hypothetical protein
MSAVRNPINQDANLRFDPKSSGEHMRGLSGKRWEAEQQKGLPLRWPTNRVEQGKLFDAWHDVASQIVNDKGRSRFRLLSAAPKLIYWKTGIIPATNEQWASSCGRCALKTVTRDIELYGSLGIYIVRYGWRKRRGDGKIVRTRIILPSLPETLKSSITLNADEIHRDTCGPDEWSVFSDIHMDTCGPDDVDLCGPGTLDTYEEGEGE